MTPQKLISAAGQAGSTPSTYVGACRQAAPFNLSGVFISAPGMRAAALAEAASAAHTNFITPADNCP